VTGQHTLKIEAARAGVGLEEYLGRLSQGLLYCWRCQDWHDAGEFPSDARRHSGRGGSCRRAIRASALGELAEHSQRPAPAPAAPEVPAPAWVVRRPQPSAEQPGSQAWAYWRGPGRATARGQDPAGTWSPTLAQDVARFPDAAQAREALIAAFGGADAVPPGCRLARLA
jgi:hypothetical protein